MGGLLKELKTKWFWFRISVVSLGSLASYLYLCRGQTIVIVDTFIGGLCVLGTVIAVFVLTVEVYKEVRGNG